MKTYLTNRTFEFTDKNKIFNKGKSETVPGQSVTITEMLAKHKSGINLQLPINQDYVEVEMEKPSDITDFEAFNQDVDVKRNSVKEFLKVKTTPKEAEPIKQT